MLDLTTPDGIDAVAANFLVWMADDPPDVGLQTSAVLRGTLRALLAGAGGRARVMLDEAEQYASEHPHSAGNGALMRTAVVALSALDDRVRGARSARRVANLTHADPLAGDSCVLWTEAVRVAVLDGRVDVSAGLDLLPGSRRARWATWLDEARAAATGELPGGRFNPNGFTVTALQAATAAVLGTPEEGAGGRCRRALHAAVRIGHDTDTVAAIAGGLLGARWGASAVPAEWRDRAARLGPRRYGERARAGRPRRPHRDRLTRQRAASSAPNSDPASAASSSSRVTPCWSADQSSTTYSVSALQPRTISRTAGVSS